MAVDPKKAERLRTAREKAEYESAADAARAFGWKEAAYRHHENGTRSFSAESAQRYGRAFKVKASWLLGLDNVADLPPPNRPVKTERLVVNSSVEAGAYRASEGWNDERAFVIEGLPSPVPGADHFGLEVVGNSMDVFYEPGEVLVCVSIFNGTVAPQTGDHVIVERSRSDGLRELTVKEYREEDGRYFLVPRSKKAGAYETIEYAGPDVDHADDSGVRVIAYVMSSYPPRVIELMRRMGMITPLIE